MRISIILLVLIVPFTVGAQFIPEQQTIELEISPQVPEANQSVLVNLSAYTFDTSGASIYWFIDGTEIQGARNQRSLRYTSKDLGEATTIKVNLVLANGLSLTTSRTVTPSRVDIVIEANTTAPSFYQGRPLPSVGSVARAIAVVHTGSEIDTSNLTYLWKLDNQVMYGGPIKGKGVAEFIVGIGREQTISVDVSSPQGVIIAHTAYAVPRVDPELMFYQENPLRGINKNAVKSPYIFTSEEATFRAEPYYMSRTLDFTNILMEWKLNGQVIQSGSTDPQYITLRHSNGTGDATLEFHVRNLNQLVQGVRDRFTVQF